MGRYAILNTYPSYRELERAGLFRVSKSYPSPPLSAVFEDNQADDDSHQDIFKGAGAPMGQRLGRPRLSKMFAKAYSVVGGITARVHRFFHSAHTEPALITEARVFLEENKHGSATPVEWIGHQQLAVLVAKFQAFGNVMNLIWRRIDDHPSRTQMNRLLEPLRSELLLTAPHPPELFEAIGRDNVTDESLDLCILFYSKFSQAFVYLRRLYEVGAFVRLKKQHHCVPARLDLGYTTDDIQNATFTKRLLAAPAFTQICKQVLPPGHCYDGSLHLVDTTLDEDFVNSIVLDINAILHDLPPPSFVQNEPYQMHVLRMYPHPDRSQSTIMASQTKPDTLPGSFPDDFDSDSDMEDSKSLKSLASTHTTHSLFRNVPFLHTNDGNNVKKSIEFDEPRHDPLHRVGVSTQSILKHRQQQRQQRAKRLNTSRMVKAVRFSDKIESPKPRSHSGSEMMRSIKNRPFPPRDGRPVGVNDAVKSLSRARASYRRNFQRFRTVDQQTAIRFPSNISTVSLPQDLGGYWDAYSKRRDVLDLGISDDVRADIRNHREEVARKEREIAKAVAEANRRAEQEKARLEEAERLAKTGGLRHISQPLVAPLNQYWMLRAQATLSASEHEVLAKTNEGTELRRHDFAKVVPSQEWLNDEIVNGALSWLDRAVNSAAGIVDYKRQTRKVLALGSFFFQRLKDNGVKGTQRTMRRFGVQKTNFFDIETILIPICLSHHWTLMVIKPGKRTIAHMDSLNSSGHAMYVRIVMEWLKDFLEEKFDGKEWKRLYYDAPSQRNSWDCGVFAITNGICLTLGVDPKDAYRSDEMPMQRLRIAGMLLNNGFNGYFALDGY